MTAPSNANTSGLENAGHVVWWKAGGVNYYPEGEAFTVSESCRVEPLVTAASAQARIEHLLARIETARVARVEHNRQFEAMKDRATAAEARADRAEARIAELATLFGVCDGGRYLNDWKARLAALQQETQP